MKMKRLLLSLFALVIIGVFTTRANCTTDDNVVKKDIVVNQDKSDYFAFPQNDSIFMDLNCFYYEKDFICVYGDVLLYSL